MRSQSKLIADGTPLPTSIKISGGARNCGESRLRFRAVKVEGKFGPTLAVPVPCSRRDCGIGPLPDTLHSPTLRRPSQRRRTPLRTSPHLNCPGPNVTHDTTRGHSNAPTTNSPVGPSPRRRRRTPSMRTAPQIILRQIRVRTAKTLVASIDQLEPSQGPTSGAPTPPAASNGGAEPTAVQAAADVHDPPLRTLGREPAGFDWIDQRTPFQRSASAKHTVLGSRLCCQPRDWPDAEAAAVVANITTRIANPGSHEHQHSRLQHS
jgi:hypothetical protein